jgi:hypothetical protein
MECYEYIDARKWDSWRDLERLRMKWDILGSNILASNESKHPWMDEGFTTYVQI